MTETWDYKMFRSRIVLVSICAIMFGFIVLLVGVFSAQDEQRVGEIAALERQTKKQESELEGFIRQISELRQNLADIEKLLMTAETERDDARQVRDELKRQLTVSEESVKRAEVERDEARNGLLNGCEKCRSNRNSGGI